MLTFHLLLLPEGVHLLQLSLLMYGLWEIIQYCQHEYLHKSFQRCGKEGVELSDENYFGVVK